MTKHMPENGLQIVMFTHQDGSVWADMANIFWGAGLRVTAAWYIATSTLRCVLYALYELQSDLESDDVMSHLRDGVTDYLRKRDLIGALTRYLDLKLAKARPAEAQAARVLTGLVKNERVGG